MNKNLDINFFDNWTPEMAWVLGWLYADGYLIDRGSFHLELKDKEIVEKVKKLLGSQNKILKRKIKRGYSYRLSIQNKHLFSTLVKLGLTPRKSKTMLFPNVPSDCLQNFIRGYFEGDGCFLHIKNHYNSKYAGSLTTSFCSGSKSFLETLRDKLIKIGFKPQSVFQNTRKTAYILRITRLDFPRWIYKNKGEIYLQRKYNKFLKIKRLLKNKIDIKEFHKGKHYSPKTEFKKGHPAWNKGLKKGSD